MTKQSVLLLMSGGVDSSTAGAMLLEQGFRVVGATMKQLDVEPTREMSGGCCSFGDVRDAKRVAAALGIDHYTVNTAPEFNQKVIVPFIKSYEAGFTPNPCVRCNSFVRFEEAFDLAKQWDCDYVATGHYARLEVDADGEPHMYRAAYREKDQSYYLYGVRKELLKMIRFPLGELTKAQVRDHAKQLGLVTAEKEESQEICFTLGRSYNEFLAEHIESEEGPILNQEGAELGKHKGVASYTVGQRKGLGLSGGPFYVTAVDPKRNAVIVGSMDDLGETSVTATSTRWIHEPQAGEKLQAKIRSRHEPANAVVNECGSGKVAIEFEQPQYGVAPGQALVLFRDDEILGGGMIVKK
ncbi:tRNA 2-thiouridine(34) synthase MnmA [bacterium]|nr:tRNA 2-thiouridine(34) synthase MnmA [bacterium]